MPYVTVARDNTTDVGLSQPWDGYDYDLRRRPARPHRTPGISPLL